MSLSGWITMTIILGGVWGGFIFLLVKTIKQSRD